MAKLKLFLLGHPVAQSRSPVMQNAALAHLGVDALYETLDVLPEDLQATLEGLEADPSVLGCNVTVPHKVAVYGWLAARGRKLLPRALVAGAVNTLLRAPDGRFDGDSTDFDGAMGAVLLEAFGSDASAFREAFPAVDVAILGSGGSARSIATNIVHPWLGVGPASVTIFARDPAKARTLAADTITSARAIGSDVSIQAESLSAFPAWNAGRRSLVIQTTTLGMETDPGAALSPVPSGSLQAGQIAFDLVYKPHDTPFLRDAAQGGATVVHGIGMLVGQGARSLEHWCASGRFAPAFDRSEVVRIMTQALGI